MDKKLVFVLASIVLLCACEKMPENGSVFTEVPGTTVKESVLSKRMYDLSVFYGNEYRLNGLYNCCKSNHNTFYFKVSDNTTQYDESYNILSHIEGLGGKSVQFEEDTVVLRTFVIPDGLYTTLLNYTYENCYIETEKGIYPLLESNSAQLLYIDTKWLILQINEVVDNVPTQNINDASFSRLVFVR